MKLKYFTGFNAWCLGQTIIRCGQQVQIQCRDVAGNVFWVWASFELAGMNNPVFYTTFGRVSPDLNETIFRWGGTQ